MQLIIACLVIWSAIGWSLAWYFNRCVRKAYQSELQAIARQRLAEYQARLMNALLRQAVEANQALRERIDDDLGESWKRL